MHPLLKDDNIDPLDGLMPTDLNLGDEALNCTLTAFSLDSGDEEDMEHNGHLE